MRLPLKPPYPIDTGIVENPIWPGRRPAVFWCLLIALLFLALRLPQLGHLLTLDEAWVLCALRSLANGGGLFTEQYWRHPPLLMELGLRLAPLVEGLEVRMELLGIFVTLAALLLFVRMLGRYFGNKIAIATGLAYALLPGPIFFDTWIKNDYLVSLLGILAVWAFLRNKKWIAGVFLGLAFLGKETAVFYAAGLGLIALCRHSPPGRWKNLLTTYLVAMAISGWWYLFMAANNGSYWAFFRGTSQEADLFTMPWWYYFVKLGSDLGWTGLLLFCAGILAVLPQKRRWVAANFTRRLGRTRLLPLFFLFPAYMVLAVSSGKPPWMTIAIQPWLALMVGLGWVFLTEKAARRIPGLQSPTVSGFKPILFPMLLLPVLFFPIRNFSHTEYLARLCGDQLPSIQGAYITADALNKVTEDKDGILILPDMFHGGTSALDPIVIWQTGKVLRIYRNLDFNNFAGFVHVIQRKKIKWALLFPVEGSTQADLVMETQEKFHPRIYVLPRGLLMEVSSLWQDQ